MDDKQSRREQSRRLLRRQRQGQLTQAEQRAAAAQRDINRQLRGWTPRRIAAWSLFGLAVVIGVVHVLAHSGLQPIPVTMGWQDILIGYPTAALLALAGLFVLDPRPAR